MTAALYARISTSEGKQHAENQLAEMRRYAERHQLDIFKEYVDEASGAKADRDALHEMLEDAHRGRFDIVLVFALDRFTRQGVFHCFRLIEKLKAAKVDFVSVTEPAFNSSGPIGELFIALAAWMAQQERLRLRERINAGLARAKAHGVKLGRPATTDWDAVDKLRAQGKSWSQVGKAMNLPRSTVSKRKKPQTPSIQSAMGL